MNGDRNPQRLNPRRRTGPPRLLDQSVRRPGSAVTPNRRAAFADWTAAHPVPRQRHSGKCSSEIPRSWLDSQTHPRTAAAVARASSPTSVCDAVDDRRLP